MPTGNLTEFFLYVIPGFIAFGILEKIETLFLKLRNQLLLELLFFL